MRETVTGYELTPGESTRYDLEFMERMHGEPIAGHWPGISTEVLAARVARGNRDPICNARARQRIGELLMQCEQVERSVTFPHMGETIRAAYHERIGHVGECATCNRPFAWPAGVTCQEQGRHAPPFTSEESARIRAGYPRDN